jgi:hypothetical protein
VSCLRVYGRQPSALPIGYYGRLVFLSSSPRRVEDALTASCGPRGDVRKGRYRVTRVRLEEFAPSAASPRAHRKGDARRTHLALFANGLPVLDVRDDRVATTTRVPRLTYGRRGTGTLTVFALRYYDATP